MRPREVLGWFAPQFHPFREVHRIMQLPKELLTQSSSVEAIDDPLGKTRRLLRVADSRTMQAKRRCQNGPRAAAEVHVFGVAANTTFQ